MFPQSLWNIIIRNVLAPVLVSLPDQDHLLNRHTLRLRQEEVDEDGHDEHEDGEEEEEEELHVAKHGEEHLGNAEGEEHVHHNVYALPSRPDLQWEDLTGNQPAQRPP